MSAHRGPIPHVKEPMRVGRSAIQQCRNTIDGKIKKIARKFLNFCHKTRLEISEVGEGVQLGKGAKIPKGSRLGHYCYVGSGFSSPSPVCIGDLCMISTSVRIVGSDHGIDNPHLPTRLDFRWKHNITTFEADVWLGHDVILLSGITIGIGSVVAAGSVVVKSVPPNTIVGGNPARIIRERFSPPDWAVYLQAIGLH